MSPTWSTSIYPHQAFLFTWWELVTCSFLLYLKILCSKNARGILVSSSSWGNSANKVTFYPSPPQELLWKEDGTTQVGDIGEWGTLCGNLSDTSWLTNGITQVSKCPNSFSCPSFWKNAQNIDQAMIRGGLAKSRRTLQGQWGMGREMGKHSQPGIKHQISLLTVERDCM